MDGSKKYRLRQYTGSSTRYIPLLSDPADAQCVDGVRISTGPRLATTQPLCLGVRERRVRKMLMNQMLSAGVRTEHNRTVR